jgi:single-stranded DNA-binding protein
MVTLTGNGGLTKDPELRYTGLARRSQRSRWRAAAVTARRIRCTSSWCCGTSRPSSPRSTLVKGQQVAFSGRLDPQPWTGRDGVERLSLEVHGVELE